MSFLENNVLVNTTPYDLSTYNFFEMKKKLTEVFFGFQNVTQITCHRRFDMHTACKLRNSRLYFGYLPKFKHE